MLNFVFLDSSRPDIAHLLVAMLQARQAVERRSWYPQESTGEDRWADVLADPRTRKRDHRVDSEVKQTACRLSDEPHATILVACSKCDWRAAYERMELMASYGADIHCQACSTDARLGNQWDHCGACYVEPIDR